MSSKGEWTRFFTLAGIPDGIAARYASSFCENRVSRDLLGDLDKETLIELGVTAVGDQMAILKRVKAVAAMGAVSDGIDKRIKNESRVTISAPSNDDSDDDDRFTTLDQRCASVQRKGKPPPDRHEIYHVKMPVGTTAKSRKILQKMELLKRNGLHPRGTSGVRQSGREVLSVAEQRELDMEVSSSTDGRFGGLHIDRLSGVRGNNGGKIVKRRIVNNGSASSSSGLFSAAIAVAGNGPIVRKKPLRVERIGGGNRGPLPSVTVQLGGRVRREVGGGIEKRIVVDGGRKGGNIGRSSRVEIVEENEYEEDEEYMDDGDIIEDDEQIEYIDDNDDMYEDELIDQDALVVGPSRGSSRVQTRIIPAPRNNSHNRRAPIIHQQRKPSTIFDRVSF